MVHNQPTAGELTPESITTYHTNNQSFTPPHHTVGVTDNPRQTSQGRQVAAKPTSGKPHFTPSFSFRKAAAVALLVIACMPSIINAQTIINWNNSDSPISSPYTITCGTTYTLSGNTKTNATVVFSPSNPSCKLQITCTSSSLRGQTNKHSITLSGGTTTVTYNNASSPLWHNAGTYTTNVGSNLTITFAKNNSNANNSSWTATITCVDCGGGGGSDCEVDCDAGNYFEDFESYAGSDNYNKAGILPTGWSYSSTGTSSNFIPHIVNQNCAEVQPCSGNRAIVFASGLETSCGNENIAILPTMNVTTGAMSFCYIMDNTILDGNNSVFDVGYVDLCGEFHTLNTPPNVTVCTSYSFNITSPIPTGSRLAFRWRCSDGDYNMYIMSIDNICVPVADCNKRTGNFYYATTAASILAGNTYTNSTLNNGTGASPVYSICPTGAGATINTSTGLVTTADGTDGQFTVYAAIPASNGYCDTVVSYTLSVSSGCPVVGDESNSDYSNGLGLATYYQYTWAEMIYTAAEMGATDGCTITSIAFKVNGASSEMDESQTTTLYLGLTAKNQFDSDDDFVSTAGGAMTASFTGTWTLHDGWNVFTLSTPFVYTDATKDLIVGMLCTNDNSYALDYIYYTTSTNRFICGYSDHDTPDPENMASFDDDYYDTKERSDYRPDIKICMNCCNIEATIEFGD